MGEEKRTPGGAILRQAIEQANAIGKMIPSDKRGIVIVGVDKKGAVLGFARRVERGEHDWVIDVQLRTAVMNGKPEDFTLTTSIIF